MHRDSQVSTVIQRPTGPRTAAGKRRSSRNALKNGLFSRAPILEGESRAELDTLLKGLWEYWQPQGTLEEAQVGYLARLLWRQRRFLEAGSAEILKPHFNVIELLHTQRREAWDRSRAGETAAGMLRTTSNPSLIRETVAIPKRVRDNLESSGF